MPIPVRGESPGEGTGLAWGGGAGGFGGGLGRAGRGGRGGSAGLGLGGGGGAGDVVVVVDAVVVVVTSSGSLPMVSTQRKSAPQAGSSRLRPRRRVAARSRRALAPVNVVTSSHPSGRNRTLQVDRFAVVANGPRSVAQRAVPLD